MSRRAEWAHLSTRRTLHPDDAGRAQRPLLRVRLHQQCVDALAWFDPGAGVCPVQEPGPDHVHRVQDDAALPAGRLGGPVRRLPDPEPRQTGAGILLFSLLFG